MTSRLILAIMLIASICAQNDESWDPEPNDQKLINPKRCGRRLHDWTTTNRNLRPDGGQIAAPEDFNWHCSLKTVLSSSFFCSAALINSQWVLTATHCVAGR